MRVSTLLRPRYAQPFVRLHSPSEAVFRGAPFHRQDDLRSCIIHYVALSSHSLLAIFCRHHLRHGVLHCDRLPPPHPQPTRIDLSVPAHRIDAGRARHVRATGKLWFQLQRRPKVLVRVFSRSREPWIQYLFAVPLPVSPASSILRR